MRRLLVFALVMLLGTTAAWADDANDCLKGEGDIQIRGCSRIIKSGKLFGKPISKTNLATAYTGRGIAYESKGEVERAIADYNKAIALDPKFAKAYTNRGIAYKNKGEFDRAIADYNKAIAHDPKFATAYTNRGVAYRKKGEVDRAIADFTKAIALNPKSAAAYTNRGIAYKNKGEFDRAIADFRKALEINPSIQKAKKALKALGVTP